MEIVFFVLWLNVIAIRFSMDFVKFLNIITIQYVDASLAQRTLLVILALFGFYLKLYSEVFNQFPIESVIAKIL